MVRSLQITHLAHRSDFLCTISSIMPTISFKLDKAEQTFKLIVLYYGTACDRPVSASISLGASGLPPELGLVEAIAPVRVSSLEVELRRLIDDTRSSGLDIKALLTDEIGGLRESRDRVALELDLVPQETQKEPCLSSEQERKWVNYFCALPWEALVRGSRPRGWGMNQVVVLRRIDPKSGRDTELIGSVPSGVAVLVSRSHKSIQKKERIVSDCVEEAKGVVGISLEKLPHYELPEYIFFCLNLNKDSLELLSPYSPKIRVLHLACHGHDDDGSLGFENIDRPTKIDWIEADRLIDMLKASDLRPEVIWLSSCYSASSFRGHPSLAQRLIEFRLTNIVIGFCGLIESVKVAPGLAKAFYGKYLDGQSALDAFVSAIGEIDTELRKGQG